MVKEQRARDAAQHSRELERQHGLNAHQRIDANDERLHGIPEQMVGIGAAKEITSEEMVDVSIALIEGRARERVHEGDQTAERDPIDWEPSNR